MQNVGGTTVFILMPFLYQQKNYGFRETLITYSADACIYILMLFIIDLHNGRNFLLIAGTVIISITFFLLPILGESILLVGFVLIQNTINMIYQAGVVISCER